MTRLGRISSGRRGSYRLPAQSRMLALEPRIVLDAAAGETAADAVAATSPDPLAAYETPQAFEANEGQFAEDVLYAARGFGYLVEATADGARLTLAGTAGSDSLAMSWVGGSAPLSVSGEDPVAMVTNYLRSDLVLSGVANYASVRYDEIYAGIDLLLYGNDQRRLEYDFVVSAGVDPSVIAVGFDGARSLSLDEAGNLVIGLDGGSITQSAPVAYQLIDGLRRSVDAAFVLNADGTVGFALGAYDSAAPLWIDPTIEYGTYVGDAGADIVHDVAVDDAGNVFVTGSMDGDGVSGGEIDAFVRMFDATGSAVYTTVIGGGSDDWATGLAVDAYGYAYVSGISGGGINWLEPNLQSAYGGLGDAFLAVLDPFGSLDYFTYYGGSGPDFSTALALSDTGVVTMVGTTASDDLATDLLTHHGMTDLFLVRFDPYDPGWSFATYLGTAGSDWGGGVALDSFGDAWVVGQAVGDAYVARIADDGLGGGSVDFEHFIGGTLDLGDGTSTVATSVAVDAYDYVYVGGFTAAGDLPTTPGVRQEEHSALYAPTADATEGWIASFDPFGSLDWLTYLGAASSFDMVEAIAVDPDGNVWVAGQTGSADFPLSDTVDGAIQQAAAFYAALSSDGAQLLVSGVIDGPGSDVARGLAIDAYGYVYVAGETLGGLTTYGADDSYIHPDALPDGFLYKLAFAGFTYDPDTIDDGYWYYDGEYWYYDEYYYDDEYLADDEYWYEDTEYWSEDEYYTDTEVWIVDEDGTEYLVGYYDETGEYHDFTDGEVVFEGGEWYWADGDDWGFDPGSLVDSLQDSDNALYRDLGMAFRDILDNGGDMDLAEFKRRLRQHDVDPEGAQPLLQLYQAMKKQARTKLFGGALEELAANPYAADAFGLAEGQSGDPPAAAAPALDIPPPQPEGRRVAVLIAVDDYSSGIPDLKTPRADAEKLAATLQDRFGFHTLVLHNATKQQMVDTLRSVALRLAENDRLMVYYAGHGYSMPANGVGFWLPADATPSSAAQWISTDDLSRFLSGVAARQIIVVSDSCYSGAFAEKTAFGTPDPDELLERRTVVVMSSGSDEPVLDEGGDGHSVFARALMDALGGLEDGRFGAQLFPRIRDAVTSAAPQTPEYGAMPAAGHQPGGDFLFSPRL